MSPCKHLRDSLIPHLWWDTVLQSASRLKGQVCPKAVTKSVTVGEAQPRHSWTVNSLSRRQNSVHKGPHAGHRGDGDKPGPFPRFLHSLMREGWLWWCLVLWGRVMGARKAGGAGGGRVWRRLPCTAGEPDERRAGRWREVDGR